MKFWCEKCKRITDHMPPQDFDPEKLWECDVCGEAREAPDV